MKTNVSRWVKLALWQKLEGEHAVEK